MSSGASGDDVKSVPLDWCIKLSGRVARVGARLSCSGHLSTSLLQKHSAHRSSGKNVLSLSSEWNETTRTINKLPCALARPILSWGWRAINRLYEALVAVLEQQANWFSGWAAAPNVWQANATTKWPFWMLMHYWAGAVGDLDVQSIMHRWAPKEPRFQRWLQQRRLNLMHRYWDIMHNYTEQNYKRNTFVSAPISQELNTKI